VCGFGDHSKEEGFCSRCNISHSNLKTEAAMMNGGIMTTSSLLQLTCPLPGYKPRSGDKHKENAQKYGLLMDDKLREAFFDKHSACYFELSRLPYFDPVRMTVIDPMHNILLGAFISLNKIIALTVLSGIVKTQWYNVWVQTNTLRQQTSTLKVQRELDQIHEYLSVVSMYLLPASLFQCLSTQQFEMPSWVA
jgi:hypothetical protein